MKKDFTHTSQKGRGREKALYAYAPEVTQSVNKELHIRVREGEGVKKRGNFAGTDGNFPSARCFVTFG